MDRRTSARTVSEGFAGNVIRRDDAGYETARRASVWNARVPDRFPALIVQAANEDDAIRAIQVARAGDLKVGICSGGHSWSGSHLRDGGMLLDLSRLTELSLDQE